MATNRLNGEKLQLKYLFRAHYKNGEIYDQNPDDVSVSDETKSCFFDVKQDELIAFELIPVNPNDPTVGVNLIDGHFEMNGVPFMQHSKDYKNFRLVYFRVRDNHFTMGMEFKSDEVFYRVGWQTNTASGKNIQRFVEVR